MGAVKNHDDLISGLFCSSTLFSSLVSFITCFLYFWHGKLSNNYPGRLVFLIAVCDFIVWFNRFINIVSNIINGVSLEELSDFYCIVSSILCCFFGIFNICATFLIVFSIFLEIVYFVNPKKYEKKGYAISIFISCAFSAIPLVLGDYGVLDDYQCWINNAATNFFVFYCPVLFVFLSDFLFIGYILYYLNKIRNVLEISSLCKKLLMFPAILMISWTPGLIRAITDCDNIILAGFMYVFMPLQGVFNPLIYGSMFEVLKRKKSDCIIQKKFNNSIDSEINNTQEDDPHQENIENIN